MEDMEDPREGAEMEGVIEMTGSEETEVGSKRGASDGPAPPPPPAKKRRLIPKPHSELTIQELMSVKHTMRKKKSKGKAAETAERGRESDNDGVSVIERDDAVVEIVKGGDTTQRQQGTGIEEAAGGVGGLPPPLPVGATAKATTDTPAAAGGGADDNSVDDEMIIVNGKIEIRERENQGGGYSPPSEQQGGRYRKKPRASADRWTKEETKQFYNGLRMYGTDFTAIAQLLPKRTRGQVKNKYKKEEKENPPLIDFALMNPTDEPLADEEAVSVQEEIVF